MHEKLRGKQPGQLTPTEQSEIPGYMTSCSAIKAGGEVGGGAAARGLAGHRSVGGEQLSSFASLVCPGFYFSLCYFFSFPKNFFLSLVF